MSTDKLMNGDLTLAGPVYADRRSRVRRAAVQALSAVGAILVVSAHVMLALQNWQLKEQISENDMSITIVIVIVIILVIVFVIVIVIVELLGRVATLEVLTKDNGRLEDTVTGPTDPDLENQLPLLPDTSRRRAKRASNALTLPLGDCDDVYKAGHTTSGVYTIQPDAAGASFRVYCEMEAGVGGWTVLQKRFDGSVDFANDWETYKNGFGDLSGEFWLGNDKIYQISNARVYVLRIDLENWSSETVYAEYDRFYIEDEAAKYRLHVGAYNGTAGDGWRGLSYHGGCRFSTHDQDNDDWSRNCATDHGGRGGWWYGACDQVNLNQPYKHGGGGNYRYGIEWHAWTAHRWSIKSSVMKIRPAP
uniref:Fibrinogen C-terminal domain-containing protein n=1 Tax=Branchiostoma floridae TaxID=7739 RepID=C3ZP31_BRAFL|eukprot:XP_002589755.1 hypothetical protein BRAFLDRAFT_97805 [Branchiostoma floridae]